MMSSSDEAAVVVSNNNKKHPPLPLLPNELLREIGAFTPVAAAAAVVCRQQAEAVPTTTTTTARLLVVSSVFESYLRPRYVAIADRLRNQRAELEKEEAKLQQVLHKQEERKKDFNLESDAEKKRFIDDSDSKKRKFNFEADKEISETKAKISKLRVQAFASTAMPKDAPVAVVSPTKKETQQDERASTSRGVGGLTPQEEDELR